MDVLLGLAAPLHRYSEDFYAASLANSALGESTLSSRLGMQVRDIEGLTYGINSRFRSPSLVAGAWYVGVTLNPANVERAIASTMEVIRKYINVGIDAVKVDLHKDGGNELLDISVTLPEKQAAATA